MSLLNQLKGFIKPYDVFAEREKIKIGKRLENGRPVSLDKFILPPTLQAVYGVNEIKEIDVLLPNWPIDKILDVKLKMYNKAGMRLCAGDGTHALRVDTTDNTLNEIECPYRECEFYKKGQCTEKAVIRLLCPKSPMLGIYQFDTGSFYSVNNLISQMKLMVTLFGRYHDIPLLLGVKKIKEQKKRYENKKIITQWVYYPVVYFRFPLPLEDMIAKYKSTTIVSAPQQPASNHDIFEIPVGEETIVDDPGEEPITPEIVVEDDILPPTPETVEEKKETPIEEPKPKKRKRKTSKKKAEPAPQPQPQPEVQPEVQPETKAKTEDVTEDKAANTPDVQPELPAQDNTVNEATSDASNDDWKTKALDYLEKAKKAGLSMAAYNYLTKQIEQATNTKRDYIRQLVKNTLKSANITIES